MTARRGCLALLLLLPLPSFAAFDDLGTGARAPGMGNAFTAIADDAYSAAYNPAGLATLIQPELGAAYSKLLVGLSDGSNLGQSSLIYAQPLRSGRWGVLGLAWQNFSLDSIYYERTLGLSYGRRFFQNSKRGNFYWGASLKNLNHGFQAPPEAFDAMTTSDGINSSATGQPDPLLAGPNSQSAWGADLGLLYRAPRHLSFGLAVQNVNSPDVAFGSDPDRLSPRTHLGVGWKGLWMNLAAELHLDPSPLGDTDKDFFLAGERYFPTLSYGQFGVRASLGTGSRSFRQITAGLSYKINKIQFDYAFLIPLGTIRQTAGTHRLGLTFHFGAHTPEEDYTEALVSQMQRVRERAGAGLGYEYSDVMRPASLDRADLAEAKIQIEAGRFLEAHKLLLGMIDRHPDDPSLFHLARRLDTVVSVYPSLPPPVTKTEQTTLRATRAFLAGDDREAVLLAAYALSLDPDRRDLMRYLARLEDSTQRKAELSSKDRNLWQDKQARSEEDFQKQDYVNAAEECRDAIILEPDDAQSLERLGTNLFMLGQYVPAGEAWRQASRLVTDPQEKQKLESFVAKAGQAQLGLGKTPAAAPPPAAPGKPAAAPPPPPANPREIEGLYEVGLEYYARGESSLAAQTFQKILDLDPGNVPAQKALERIQRGTR